MKAEWTNSDSLTTSQTTKAILVIDIPNELDVNDLLIDYCVHTKGEYKQIRKGGNYSLKPMPNKKPVSYHDDLFGEVEKNFNNIGWNACLDEILGETE